MLVSRRKARKCARQSAHPSCHPMQLACIHATLLFLVQMYLNLFLFFFLSVFLFVFFRLSLFPVLRGGDGVMLLQGGLVPGHVLIVPVSHQQRYSELSAEGAKEAERYKDSFKRYVGASWGTLSLSSMVFCVLL